MVARSPLSFLCSLGRGSRLRTIVGLRIPSRVSLSFGSPVGRPELFGRRDSDYAKVLLLFLCDLIIAKVLLSRCLLGRTPCGTGSLLCCSCRRHDRLGSLSAHAVSPPRDHARDPGIRARSAGQGLLGAHAVSSPRDHARDPGSFVHAVPGRAWLVSPQTPAGSTGWLHHRQSSGFAQRSRCESASGPRS